MLENEVFNRPYVRDITKTCECTCSVTCNPDIITNADRIRAMSDEELADFIDKCEGMGYVDSSIARDKNGHCIDMLDWLRSPAEEDT